MTFYDHVYRQVSLQNLHSTGISRDETVKPQYTVVNVISEVVIYYPTEMYPVVQIHKPIPVLPQRGFYTNKVRSRLIVTSTFRRPGAVISRHLCGFQFSLPARVVTLSLHSHFTLTCDKDP